VTAAEVRELLPLYALGVLDDGERAAVERAAATDPAIAAELASYADAASSLVGEPNPVEPDEDIRIQLIASSGGGRFASYAPRMGQIFDVAVDRAHELLGLVERKRSWELPMPGIGLVHFDGGPTAARADCGFVRLAPGCVFPQHRHRGEELSIILQGSVRDQATGKLIGVGDELIKVQDSEHQLVCEGSVEAIFASRAFDGIEIGGQRVGPRG
jgi:hypothetical protein